MIRKLSFYLSLLMMTFTAITGGMRWTFKRYIYFKFANRDSMNSSLYNVTFIAFHDYNGNGKRNDGEPFLADITAQIDGEICSSGEDGTCSIADIANGHYESSIIDNREVMAYLKMRYILPSISEVGAISSSMDVFINNADAVIYLTSWTGKLR